MYDAIVLAGGSARRLGGADKPGLDIAGTTLLDRVVAALPAAHRVVVAGPRRPMLRDVVWRRESPPGGGPVAAVAAGLPATAADAIVVVGADLPVLAPAVPLLLSALQRASAALLVEPEGRVNYLAGAWRRSSLARVLAALGDPDGASMRSLAEAVGYVGVADTGEWGRDCDTWADVAAARGRL